MFVGLYTFFGSNGLMEIMRKKRIENNLDQDMEKMKRGNILLRSRIWSLQNSDLEVERIAREMLFLIKPGERVYLIDEK
jgi:cell division protein FtsB